MENITTSNTLVAMFHGYATDPSGLSSLKTMVEKCYPGAIIVTPKLPLSIFSTAKIENVIKDVMQTIDVEWQKIDVNEKKKCKVILIGHSMGAIIMRKVYLNACEKYSIQNDKITDNSCGWVNNVDRLVYLAAIHSGWSINSRYNIGIYFLLKLLEQIGKTMWFLGMKPIGFEFKKGAPFITELRMQSLKLKNIEQGNALSIQLLGTQDEIVSPETSIDLITGSQFIYLDVPFSNHRNVRELKTEKRKEIFKSALTLDKAALRKMEVLTSDDTFIAQDTGVTDVVFVIHGIRDYGYWTIKLANRVKKLGEKQYGKKYRTETSTYGYFPMGAFLLRQFRSSKVEWLMERYVENMAYYPNAKFSFVGHSNGTYLLARSLKDYPSCEFKNIVLAGSVVKSDYDWQQLIKEGRVKSIYNFVADNDWVVGIFPKTFQTLRIQDLGSGGFDGFSSIDKENQFVFIEGGHSAAVNEKVWEDVAYVAVNGKLNDTHQIQKKDFRSLRMKLAGDFSPLLMLLIIAGVIGLGYCIYLGDYSIQLKLLFLALYTFVIYKILTWF